jgi:L-asparaginase II
MTDALLATTSRGDELESLHTGAIAVTDGAGRLVASFGDPSRRVHLRSTAKPFQLLPLLMDGLHTQELPAADGGAPWRLEDAELAVMMASHSGEPDHTARVQRLMERGGIALELLQCGAHAPVWRAAADALVRADQAPTALHNNCSGKHTGMLLVCKHRGWPLDTYLHPDHPLQRRILHGIAALAQHPADAIGLTTDGCSAPCFVLPLHRLAALFATLASPHLASPVEGRAPEAPLRDLFRAATAHPALIAGSGRIDTALMRALPGQLLAKIGAKGAHALAVAPSPRWPDGLGIALKIDDGDDAALLRPALLVHLLRQLDVLGDDLPEPLRAAADPVLYNLRGLPVGHITPAFTLTPEAR